jgi:hypothetical protein
VVRVAVCVLLVAGCGRVDFDALPQPSFSEFAPPIALTELNGGAATDDPTVREDQREIFFATYRDGALVENVWTSVRASTTDAWAAPTMVAEVDGAANTGSPELSFDGLTLYTSMTLTDAGNIQMSTRATVGDAFSAPVLIDGGVNTAAEEFSGTPSADGLELYFHHVVGGTGGGTGTGEIWVATRASTSEPWGTGQRIDGLADGSDARNPFPTADGLSLYFSDRPADAAHSQIFRATRRTRESTWSAAEAVESLRDDTADVADPWLSADESVIYLSVGDGIAMATAL